MLAEFIEKLRDMAVRANAGRFYTHEKLPEVVRWESGDGQTTEHYDVPPPLRSHLLEGLADIVAVAEDKLVSALPELWVCGEMVDVVLNRNQRGERARCYLHATEQFETLTGLTTPRQFEPKAAIKLLRFDLHGADSEGLVQALTRVDFLRRSEGTSTVEHGKESLGRMVEAAVQQADSIPDRFTVTVPIWSGFATTVSVHCGVYLDLETQRVELRVLADEIQRVTLLAVAGLAVYLESELDGIPVFKGRA